MSKKDNRKVYEDLPYVLSRVDGVYRILVADILDDTDNGKNDLRRRADRILPTLVENTKDNKVNVMRTDSVARLRMSTISAIHELLDTYVDIKGYKESPNRIRLISILSSMGYVFETVKGLRNMTSLVPVLRENPNIPGLTDRLVTVALELKSILIEGRSELGKLKGDDPINDEILNRLDETIHNLFDLLTVLTIYLSGELQFLIEDDNVSTASRKLDAAITGGTIGFVVSVCTMLIVHFLLHM